MKLNFGESFIKWVNTIYKGAESCDINNGWTSKPFKVSKGIRQCCPLSALLFLLVVEILAINIRSEEDLGLKIKINEETMFLKDETSVVKCLKQIEQFGTVSGLKLNKEKPEGFSLGGSVNRNDQMAGINWNKSCVKALGVYFGYDKKETEEKNWNDKLGSIKRVLSSWKKRDLSFQGRILIIKALALPKVVYLVSAINTPNWIINEINKEFLGFVWKGKRDKIARKVLINNIKNGGLNMVDFKSFCLAMKASWASKLYKSTNETWTIIPNKYFENCDIATVMCMNAETVKQIPFKLPEFYLNVVQCWHLCGGGCKTPQSAYEIRQEMIWGNKFIQSKGKTLFFNNWRDSNFIDDLLDETGNFKSGQKIFE